jgi:hypothetical protein
VLLWQVHYLQTRILAIVENNTKAMVELKVTVERWLTAHVVSRQD